MGDSNLTAAGVLSDAIRGLFSWLDRPTFGLLSLVYQLFFNVASATLFSGPTIMNFFSRVQLILGVFTMFQLAMSILKGIVNPDNFFGKDKGVKSIISRIVIALIMLTLITPISIPAAKNEYEKQINNNGILFGTLYSLQHRLLSNNTLGRLILGTTDTSPSYISSDSDDELKTSSRIFTSTVLKAFYRINLIDYNSRKHEAGKDDAVFNENRVCQDIDDDVLAAYTRLDADPGEIIDMVNATCDSDGGIIKSVIRLFKKLTGNEYYVFAYTPLLGAVVAFIFSFILLSFTVDVAVRAVKLSVLRLIAPIPIISYMNPNGTKDNAFNSWVKTLTTTYLDLFVRLAVVYFVIFLIQDMIANGLAIKTLNGQAGIFSLIIIWIGLFIFAKQAPKFFKDVLGLKNDPGKLFGGFGQLGSVLGLGAAAVGTIGSARASYMASKAADDTNGVHPDGFLGGALNRGKHIVAGVAGGVTGFGTGVKAALTAKDHAMQAVIDSNTKRNAANIARGKDGSTLLGRMSSSAQRLAFGQDSYEKETAALGLAKARENAAKDLFGYLEGKGKTDGADYSVSTKISDGFIVNDSVNGFNKKIAKAKADMQSGRGNGDFSVSYTDANGTNRTRTLNVNDAVTDKIASQLGYEAGRVWASTQDAKQAAWVARGSNENDNDRGDNGYIQKRDDYAFVAESGREFDSGTRDAVNTLKKTSKIAGGAATHIERSKDYSRHKADHGASGGK